MYIYIYMYICATVRNSQVKKAWQDFPEDGDYLEKLDLDLTVNCVNAATALQLKNLATAHLGEVKKNVTMLTTNEVCIPVQQVALISKRYALHRIAEGDLLAWMDLVSLEHSAKPWSIDNPKFGAIEQVGCPSTREEGDILQDDEMKYCSKMWQEAVISSQFMGMIAALTLADDEDAKNNLVALLRAWLTDYERAKPHVMGGLKESAGHMHSVFGGLLGLLDPTPGVHGACLDMINYIMPPNGTNPVVTKDLPRTGRLLLNELRKGTVWSRRNIAYQEKVGAEVRFGPALRAATTDALRVEAFSSETRPLSKQETEAFFREASQLLDSVTENIGTWRAALRPGATQELEDNLSRVCALLYQIIVRHGCTEDSMIRVAKLQTFLRGSHLQNASVASLVRSLVHDVGDTLMQWSSEDTAKRLTESIDWFKRDPNFEAVEVAVTSLVAGTVLPEEVAELLHSAFPRAAEWLADGDGMAHVCSPVVATFLQHISVTEDQKQFWEVVQAVVNLSVSLDAHDKLVPGSDVHASVQVACERF